MARPRTAHSIALSREASQRRKNENRARLAAIKETAQCADCPIAVRWPACALGFDHLPGEGDKVRNVADLCSRSWAVIQAEIAKTEVVCHNHHAMRTAARRVP